MTRNAQADGHRAGGWLARFRTRRRVEAARAEAVHRLYGALVGRARRPGLYDDLGVPDTPEGRFEMVAAQVALAVRRLQQAGERELAQDLFDLMFRDMDQALREIGVGDMSVGVYVKRLARNFYARLDDLDAALKEGDAGRIETMLRRNAYKGGEPPDERRVRTLAGLLLEEGRVLERWPLERLRAGDLGEPGSTVDRSSTGP